MKNLILSIEGIDFLYAIIGILFVFMLLLILIIYVGVQAKVFGKKKDKKTEQIVAPVPVVQSALPQVQTPSSNEDELVAAITAAIMIYYDTHSIIDSQTTATGFIVRKIKKI